MPVFYNKIERGDPSDASAPKLWYPVLKSTGLVKEKEVSQLLAEETTLNPKEAEMAVYQLFKVVVRLLLDGHTVQLSDLGNFRLIARARGKGVATEAEVTAASIQKLVVHFAQSEEMKDAIKKAVFKDISTMSNK
jgi:predicted histone-like DNA-binding protein